MKQEYLPFLKGASDFKFLEAINVAAEYEDECLRKKVFAFGVTWTPELYWIDRIENMSTFRYTPSEKPAYPQDLRLEVVAGETQAPQWTNSWVNVYWDGALVYSQTDNWGRKKVERWIEIGDFEQVAITSKDDVIATIKSLNFATNRKRK